MLIEIHMIKNFASTNLNRDDSGSPKTCVFGGTPRSRISSQCLKHNWREYMRSNFDEQNFGIRTRKLPERIADEFKEMGYPTEYTDEIKKAIVSLGKKEKKSSGTDGDETKNEKDSTTTAQIVFYAPNDIEALKNIIKDKLGECKSPKDVKKVLSDIEAEVAKCKDRAVSVDMALFGRMVTSKAFNNIEASVQVAHAIGTTKAIAESDYFAAIDDWLGNDSGAAMLGDTDYNSACYYYYISLDVDKLADNLRYNSNKDELIKKLIPSFVEAIAFADPTGKQNSFASHPLPSALLIECKDNKIPVSLANAFEKPVKADKDGGVITQSVERVKSYVEKQDKLFGLPFTKRCWFTTETNIKFSDNKTINCESFKEVLDELSI